MRAAIYARVSTRGQMQKETIGQQVSRLTAYVQTKGWQLESEHVYLDDGYSGATLARPALDSLRDRSAFAEFDVVVITSPDRLARNYLHQMVVIDELERRGIQLEFLDQPMSDDPHDRLLVQIRGAVAEYERTLITERTRRGRLQKYRQQQLLPWTRPLFGYQVNPARPRDPAGVQVKPTEAALIAQMFAWYLEPTATLYQVASRLTQLKIPTPGGKARWLSATVRNLLRNTAYIGTAYANRFRSEPATRRHSALQAIGVRGHTQVERPEKDWIAVPVPAIVDPSTFERVQEKLAHNRQWSSRNNTAHRYLLRSLVSCGLCRLNAPAREVRGYHYYVCRGHTDLLRAQRGQRCTARFVPAAQLDDLVWQDLVAVLTDPETIAMALQRAHGGHWLPDQLQRQSRNLQQAQRHLDSQQARLLDAYLANILTLSEFERKRTEFAHKQAALSEQQSQLQATMLQRRELSQVADSIEAFCQTIRPTLANASFPQRQQLVQLLIDRVVVTDEHVEIRYAIPTRPTGPHLPFCHLYKDYREFIPAGESGSCSHGLGFGCFTALFCRFGLLAT